MLPLDAILMRACLAALAGLGASLVTSNFWAILVAIALFYLLLVIARKPVQRWPQE